LLKKNNFSKEISYFKKKVKEVRFCNFSIPCPIEIYPDSVKSNLLNKKKKKKKELKFIVKKFKLQ
jgi:hypothetical protein